MDLIRCPHCHARVVLTSGRECPSCHEHVDKFAYLETDDAIQGFEPRRRADSDSLETVATFNDPIRAALAKNCLEAAGVGAYLADVEMATVAWQFTNAIGFIKLQVASPDAEHAREVLADQLASTSEGGERAAEEEDPTRPVPDAGEDLDSDQEEGPDEFEPEATRRERNAERAFRGAVFGLLFFPLQPYVTWLLIRVFISDEPLRGRPRTRAIWAAAINLPWMFGLALILRAMLASS